MSKQISVADDVYDLLKALRRPDESFTDVLRRIGEQERRRVLMGLAGSWKMTDEQAKKMLDEIYAARRASQARRSDA